MTDSFASNSKKAITNLMTQRNWQRLYYDDVKIYFLSYKWMRENGVFGFRNGISWTRVSWKLATAYAYEKYYDENYKDGIPIHYMIDEYLDALMTDYRAKL